MDRRINHQVVRLVVCLCEVAAVATDMRLRQDVLDEAAVLVDLVTASQPDAVTLLRQWCRDTHRLVSVTGDTAYREAAAYALVHLLRLQASLGVEKKVEPSVAKTEPTPLPVVKTNPDDLRKAPRLVLELVRSHPGIRTGQLETEIGREFSSRTLKRSLKELIEAGFIIRQAEGTTAGYVASVGERA